MTTVSKHDYAARVLRSWAGGTDTVLSLVEGAGDVSLDTARVPHVQGSITVAVEDAALLDQLDPRDSRRVRIDATRADHTVNVYTPWVEADRNRFINPAPATVTGFAAASSTQAIAAGGIRLTSTLAISGQGVRLNWNTAGSRPAVTPGETVQLSAESMSPNGRPASLSILFYNAAGAYITGSVRLGANFGGTASFTRGSVTAVVPAGAVTAAFYFANGMGLPIAVGDQIVFRRIRFGTPGPYFTGATTAPDVLTRYRWLGAVNASAAVMETRLFDRVEWVPDVTRSFNLGIREATPDRAAGTVTLRLASDEALLDDSAQLVDDATPRQYEASLRALTGYVLGKIGATLTPGALDADMTAYWDVLNLLPNPSVEGVLAPWTAAGNCAVFQSSPALSPPSGTAAAGFNSLAAGPLAVAPTAIDGWHNVTPGKPYTLTGYGRASGTTPPRSVVPVIRWIDERDFTPWGDISGAPVPINSTGWARAALTATAPAGAVKAYVFFRVTGSTAAGQIGYLDCAMFTQTAEPIPYYDGSTPDDEHYAYTWDDEANASPSRRTALQDAPTPEAFVWYAGVSGMRFLEPLLKASGLRLVCDEQRRWTLRDVDYRADGSQTYRYGVNIEAADESLSRESGDWFDAAVYEYVWTDDAGIEQRRVDAFTLNNPPTKVLRVEVQGAYPGPGRAEHIVRRAQARGRTVTVTSIPTWLEHTDQALSVLLDGTPIQTGIAGTVSYNFADDTVTVSSRTTDTPAAAWILIPEGETWSDSPAGESWTEEII